MKRLSASHGRIPHPFFTISQPDSDKWRLPGRLRTFPGISCVVDRMGAIECHRRLFHMSPGLLPFGLLLISRDGDWSRLFVGLVVLFSVAAFALAVAFGPSLTRLGEQSWMHAVVGYMIPVVAPLLLFPERSEFGLMTLQILALGDGSATLGGLLIGGRPLPWNRHKTFSGLICFVVFGSLAATCGYWIAAQSAVSFGTAFLICGMAAVCVAVVESLPIQSNDNLRVGTTALLAGVGMSTLVS